MKNIKIGRYLGFYSNLILSLSTSVGLFLIIPLIISNYGQKALLIWSLVSSYCGLLLIFDFGITSVMARKLSELFKDTSSFSSRIWGHFLKFHAKILFIGSVLVFLIFIFQSIFGNILGLYTENILIFSFLLVATLSTIASHQQILKFHLLEIYPLALTFLAISKIIETGLIFLLIIARPPFPAIACAVAAIRIFEFLILRTFANQRLFNLRQNTSNVQGIDLRRLDFVSSVLYSASTILGIHATYILQSFFLTPNQVITVLISRMMAAPIRIFADSLAIGNFDKLIHKSLSSNVSKKQENKFIIFLWSLLLGFSGLYVLLINIVGDYFFNFLSQGKLSFNLVLMNLFVVATLLDGVIVIYMQTLISAGSLGRAGSAYFGLTIFSLVFLVPLINPLGMFAGVASIIFCDTLFFLYSARVKKSRVQE